jgi:hypothetical protein
MGGSHLGDRFVLMADAGDTGVRNIKKIARQNSGDCPN